ncbi:phosphoribosylaminoimidazolesuccinocarboxamide synthase [Bacteroidota bacterium]
MAKGLKETNFSFPGQTDFYRGKVRDVYIFDKKMAMVATDRISAFDIILPEPIPYKGQILNQIACKSLEATSDIVPNWLESSPDPNVSFGKRCNPLQVEMVIRGYVAGHAWREYRDGKRTICGEPMPDGMNENDKFPAPIITPSTKAHEGHDLDISREEIIENGLVQEDIYDQLAEYTRALFERGVEIAAKQGLILVDTKYEFGILEGHVYLIDEIHTPDSSRYFYMDGYQERQERGEEQKQLSKEFVRQWLIGNGFQGLEGQKMPEFTEEVVEMISNRYIELYENFTGEKFNGADYSVIMDRIKENILKLA